MTSTPPLTLRIRTEQDQDIDWIVKPDEITFHQALEVISRILPGTTTTSFQYVDSDGERITVRSDDELQAMFQMYFCELSEDDLARGLLPPLIIYPRVGKTPKARNIHDLKISTGTSHSHQQRSNQSQSGTRRTVQSHGMQAGAGAQPVVQSHGIQPNPTVSQVPTHRSTTTSENIKEILTCGSITAVDIQQIDMIGRGNGGLVYKALHLPTQRLMAVKVIQLAVDVTVQKKILSELEILYKCHSPSIICFYGAFFIDNRISVCTEFMDGGSLDRYGQIPEEIVARMAMLIVKALIYMWSLKILHRDIKPSNILVNTQGEVKLCDFGVSTQLVESIAMTYIGTNAYMAPERIKAQNYGAQSEVWSLGVTLFELATGEFPYKDFKALSYQTSYNIVLRCNKSPGEMLAFILDGNPPRLQEGLFSPALVDFVSRCMQKEPSHRIPHLELHTHPFIQQFVHNDRINLDLAPWIQSQLPRIQQQ